MTKKRPKKELVGVDPPAPQIDLADAKLRLAVEMIGYALRDIGLALVQGPREENQVMRGKAALGLERAAAYVRGEDYVVAAAPQHANIQADAAAIKKGATA
jgi:hypothetical protein